MVADRFLSSKQQLEDEGRTDGVHRRHDDVGKLCVVGNFEFIQISHPISPADLHCQFTADTALSKLLTYCVLRPTQPPTLTTNYHRYYYYNENHYNNYYLYL